MREIGIIGASVVGFFVLLAFLARGTGETTTAVNDRVRIGQLEAELSAARAEAGTLRDELEKSRAELKQAGEAALALRKRVDELEKRAAGKVGRK